MEAKDGQYLLFSGYTISESTCFLVEWMALTTEAKECAFLLLKKLGFNIVLPT